MGHLPLPSSSTAIVKRRRSAGRAHEREEGGEETYPAPAPFLSRASPSGGSPPSPPPPLPLLVIPQNAHRVDRGAPAPRPFLGQLFLLHLVLRPSSAFVRFSSASSSSSSDQFLRRRPLPSLPSLPALKRSLVFPFPQLASPFRRSPRPRFRGRISSHWPRVYLEGQGYRRVLTRIAGGNEDSGERDRRTRSETSESVRFPLGVGLMRPVL